MNSSIIGVDVTSYPEGYQKVIDALDFLPDDANIREDFMLKFFKTIIKR